MKVTVSALQTARELVRQICECGHPDDDHVRDEPRYCGERSTDDGCPCERFKRARLKVVRVAKGKP